MAKRKSRGRRRNTTNAIARVRAPLATARKTNPARRRRRSGGRRRNPLSVAGLKPMQLVSAGVASIVTSAIGNVVTASLRLQPDGWGQVGVQLGLAVAVHKFWPRSFEKEAAVIGAATPAVVSVVNRLVPNVGSVFGNLAQGLLPAPPAPAPQPVGDGMGGFVNIPPGSPLYRTGLY